MINSTNSINDAGVTNVRRLESLPTRNDGHICFIIPVFNEEESITSFLDAMAPYLSKLPSAEIIFVNDGSTDKTLQVLLQKIENDPSISVINLARNFGKEAAMCAGLDSCDADAVVIMDVDLQDPPDLIPQFYNYWKKGYDVVLGERKSRHEDSFLKKKTALAFYSLFNQLSDTKIPSNVGDFRLLDSRVVLALGNLRERNRFMKGLYAWVGFSTISVPYERPARLVGKSKFKFKGLWRFAMDGIFGFSTVPLKLSVYSGILVAIIAFIYGLFIVIRTLVYGIDLPGYASLMTVILVLSSVQLVSMGIMGEYIARLTNEAKRRPLYIVEGQYVRNDTDTDTDV